MHESRDVEAHLGFRVVPVRSMDAEAAQLQRLSEEGKVTHVRPASLDELSMFRLLTTPQKEWG